jgi:hypothetical protein
MELLTRRRHRYRVLVPGAGLGRLVFDLACLGTFPNATPRRRLFVLTVPLAGYDVEGNEFSYFMLLTSQTMLNW